MYSKTQYFGENTGEHIIVVNIDKKEYFKIPPSNYEKQIKTPLAPITLYWLLTHKNFLGYSTVGRWAGDKVLVIPEQDPQYKQISREIAKGRYKSITVEVVQEIAKFCRTYKIPYWTEKFEKTAKKLSCLKRKQRKQATNNP